MLSVRHLSAAALAAAILAAGCKPGEAERRPAPAPLPVDLVAAPSSGDVQEIVQREVVRARSDGHRLLVYVGADWCEPCQRFHDAARAGQIDAAFPGLRLIEFDFDRDKERLDKAGYWSHMLPLFALPRTDGKASGEQIEGSIKGAGAVDQIAPRLKELLAKGG